MILQSQVVKVGPEASHFLAEGIFAVVFRQKRYDSN